MSDLTYSVESAIQKIPYAFILLTSLGLLLTFYFPGLVDLEVQLNESQQSTFRKATVLQNLVSVHPDSSQRNSLNYDLPDRRSLLAAEYFTQRASSNSIGYRIENGYYCYIPEVNGLDGENYGFAVLMLEQKPDYSPPDSACTTTPQSHLNRDPVYSPVLIKGEDGKVPARVIVYEVPN